MFKLKTIFGIDELKSVLLFFFEFILTDDLEILSLPMERKSCLLFQGHYSIRMVPVSLPVKIKPLLCFVKRKWGNTISSLIKLKKNSCDINENIYTELKKSEEGAPCDRWKGNN